MTRAARVRLTSIPLLVWLALTTALPAAGHEAHRRAARAETAVVAIPDGNGAAGASPAVAETGEGAGPSISPPGTAAEPAAPPTAGTAHEHATVDSEEADGFLIRLGRLHPAIVHFPIALVLMVALAELLNLLRPAALYNEAARFMLIMAVLFAPPTAVLGWLFAEGEYYDGLAETLLFWHRWLGVAIVPLSLAALILRWKLGATPAGRQLYYAVMGLTAVAVAAAGFLGGSLTHGLDHFRLF